MKKLEIVEYLKKNITPHKNSVCGNEYRTAVYLKNGVYIPCVVFSNADALIDLFEKRLDEKKIGVKDLTKSFFINKNIVNSSDIEKIEESRNAMPKELLEQIKGETLMSWTGFVLKMKDGKCFNFGTSFSFSFFELPSGYDFSDVEEVINHSYADENGIQEYRKHKLTDFQDIKIYHAMDFFNCYVENL